MRSYYTPYSICIGVLLLLMSIPQLSFSQCTLSVYNQVTVPLGSSGFAVVPPSMLVSGTTGDCSGSLTIEIFDSTNTNLGNIADCSIAGTVVAVRVTHDNSGASFWTSILVEDTTSPTVSCTSLEIDCSASTLPADVGGVVGLDNCDLDVDLNYSETIEPLVADCSSPLYYRVLTRTWTATDNFDNVSATCQQTISIRRADIADVIFPPNYDNMEENALDCSAEYPTSAVTGVPTIYGNSVDTNCKLTVGFTDNVIDLCAGTYKVLRTWTVLDCCTSATRTETQLIKVADTTAPVFTCPSTLTVNTDAGLCVGTVVLPALDVEEDCSGFSTIIYSPFGSIATNGGTYANIPLGTYDFNYVLTDGCGTASSCMVAVTVEDNEGPTMICEGAIDVSIGTSGYGIVQAVDLDEASSDACCAITLFEVKELAAADATYASTITFDCTDLGLQTVTLRATDCEGNTNTCNIQVEVEDKVAPTINCPLAVIVECAEYPAGEDLVSVATGEDNCGVPTITPNDVETLTDCNTGTVLRTYTATDAQGFTATCEQTITYIDNTAPTVTFPADITINSCDMEIGDIEAGVPVAVGDCEVFSFAPLGVDSDAYFETDSGCGVKILRTHQVTELCSEMMYSHVQTIIIEDNEGPVFNQAAGALDLTVNCDENYTFPPDIPLTATDFCGGVEVVELDGVTLPGACISAFSRVVTYRATDDCGNSTDYVATLTVEDNESPVFTDCSSPAAVDDFLDLCSTFVNVPAFEATDNCDVAVVITNNSAFATTSNADISGTYPVGMTVVTLTATDACGNQATCDVTVQVNDITAPDINCPSDPISVVLNADEMAEISLDNFPTVTFSDDCSGLSEVGIVDGPLTLNCDNAIFLGLTPVPIPVVIYAIDGSGNPTQCPAINAFAEIPAGSNLCDDMRGALVYGTIFTETNERVEGVEVLLADENNTMIDTSAENGSYLFTSEYPDGDCSIIPYNNDNLTNGVTSYDLVLIKKHILNIEYLDSPYKKIAADVNNTGTITMSDIVAIKKVILGLEQNYPNNTSWRFFPKEEILDANSSPSIIELPAEYLLVEPAWFTVGQDFIAVKIGDVNNSAE